MKFAIAFLLTLLVAGALYAPANAGPPSPGVYQTIDLGGTMLPGRYSESWAGPSGWLTVGNTNNTQSWDGANLGAEWTMICAQVSQAPVLIQDTVDSNGNGIKQWQIVYSGGAIVLDSSGPWGGDQPSYTAPFTSCTEIRTFHYSNFTIASVIGTVQIQAEIDGYSDCLTLSIFNRARHGDTDTEAFPGASFYPGFLDPGSCAATRTYGVWGVADELTLVISGNCTVPVEEATWSAIKSIYGD